MAAGLGWPTTIRGGLKWLTMALMIKVDDQLDNQLENVNVFTIDANPK